MQNTFDLRNFEAANSCFNFSPQRFLYVLLDFFFFFFFDVNLFFIMILFTFLNKEQGVYFTYYLYAGSFYMLLQSSAYNLSLLCLLLYCVYVYMYIYIYTLLKSSCIYLIEHSSYWDPTSCSTSVMLRMRTGAS